MELDTFLTHVFGDVPENEVIGIVQRGKDGHGWVTKPYKKGRTKLQSTAASYYCISTLKAVAPGEPLRRLMPNAARTYGIVCDDVGTKVPVEMFKGKFQPHYVMETSAGNFQYHYNVRMTPEQAQVLIEAFIEAGYSDPGARDIHRLVRLPGSLNYKYDPPFVSRLVEENWDMPPYTFEELVEDFGLKPREPTSLRASRRTWSGDAGGDVILKWLTEQGMVLSEPNDDGWVFIECPWADGHSDGRTDAKYMVGNGATGSMRCFHGSCQHRTQQDFRLWCTEHGAPDFDDEAGKRAMEIGKKLAQLPKGAFAPPPPVSLPAPPEGAPAGDILMALVLKYAPMVDRKDLPSLEVTSKRQPKDIQKPVSENIQYIIDRCEFGVLRNHMTGEVELTHSDKTFNTIKSHEERSTLIRELLVSLAQRVGIPVRATLSEILNALAGNKGYHPIIDWIGKKKWDGVDRLALLCSALETEHPVWRDIVVKRWCIQCIAAWTNWMREAPYSIPHLLVLVGPQGCGKSSFFGSLLPAMWRLLEQGAHLGHANSKDDERRILSTGFTEMSEIESIISRIEAGAFKSFISRPVDKIRLPYDRHITVRPRCTPLCGSVNDTQFLNDTTGSRRFWPLEVKKCNFNHGIDMQQFWAQMMHMFEQKEGWNLTAEETAMHAAIIDEHRVVSNAEGRLEELHARMQHIDRKEWTFATPSTICRYYGLDNNYMNSRVAGGYLRKTFGPRVSNNGRKGWLVPIRQTEFISGFSPYIPPEKK